MEQEFAPGSLQEKVSWYQAILHHALGWRDVPLNGKHNDPPTRARMREFQKSFCLNEINGYLTVEANAALTEVALYWLYSLCRPQPPFGDGWGKGIRDAVSQFQRDYGLEVDGKVGTQTRRKMVSLLIGQDGLTMKNYHPYLTSRNLKEQESGNLAPLLLLAELGSGYDKGIFGQDDRKRVNDTISIPHRWMCYIKVLPGTAGSGVLISPRHVLTAAHVVYSPRTDSKGRILPPDRANTVTISLGYNNAPRNTRVYQTSPFGTFKVNMKDALIPLEYIKAQNGEKDETGRVYNENDWDFAVLTLDKPVGTMTLRPKKLRARKGKIDVRPRRVGCWLEENRIDIGAEEEMEGPDLDNHRLWSWDKLKGRQVFTEGYPADLKGLQATNVKMPSSMPKSLTRSFAHYLDSASGQSGSPLWLKENDGVLSLIGVSHGVVIRPLDGLLNKRKAEKNLAIAITPKIVTKICEHFSETFEPLTESGKKIVGLGLKANDK